MRKKKPEEGTIMKNIAMILAPGFEESEAVVTADLLRRAGVNLYLAGLEGVYVTGAHDITMEADMLLSDLPDSLDGLILPGGQPGSTILSENAEVLEWVKRLHNDSCLVAAICAAPAMVLGKSGILEGRQFTCFPGLEGSVKGAHFIEEPVVQDSNIITSRGLGTAGLFGLKLVEYLVDEETAKKLGRITLLL